MEGFDSTDESTRIAVAIEPLLYCKLVVSLLESVPGFRVVARLTAWRDVASLSRMNGASILVVRLQEGDHHARGLLQCAISLCPDVRTIALVSGCTPRSARALLKLAVQGIVDEGSEDGDIAEAVRVVRSGRAYLCPTAATAIARHVSDAVADESCDEIGERGGGNEDPVRIASLSSREKQVLLLLGHGATRSEVAEMLHIGPNTVDSHRRRMMEKLGARNFRDLLRFATRIES